MDLVKLAAGCSGSDVGAGDQFALELPAIRLVGASGSAALSGGCCGGAIEVMGGGADWNRAATLLCLRAR